MVLFIFKLAIVFISIIYIHQNVTRFLHVFQLSFYNFTEFFPTVMKTKECRFGIGQLCILSVVILSSFFNSIWCYIIWILILLITIYINKLLKPKSKKQFVLTTRIKVTYIIIYLFEISLLIFPLLYFAYIDSVVFYFFALFLGLYKYTSLFYACLGNAISKVIFKITNKKYIKKAKNKINDMSNMKIVGVTGSYGKTSTKNIINAILSENYSTVMTPKSFNTTLGVTKSIIQDIKPYTEIFVCEMGAARLGEIKEICEIASPDFSIITSIGPQHLTTFKSVENVQKGKFEIVENAKESAVCILNIDNDYINSGIDMYTNGRKVIKYAINAVKDADFYARNIITNEEGSSFEIVCFDDIISVKTKLLGKHNIYNILCAVALAKQFNISNDVIIKAIKKIKPIEHRLEMKNMSGILALDDSFNSNPEGSKMAIECLNMFKDKYKVLVTPGMIELGKEDYELNKNLGIFATSCDFVLLVGNKNTKAIKDGLDEKNYKNYMIVDDVYEAFNKLNQLKVEHPNLIALFENDLPDSYS